MLTLKQIKTHNIQSHRDITVDLPETGLIRFSGENSNGKSVINKALTSIASDAIRRPAKRKSLITRGCEYGEVTLTRSDDVVLYFRIHLEAAQTFAELRNGDNVIRRYLADKTIPELVSYFGIHYSDTAERSLNFSDADDALLFYKTSHGANDALLQTSIRDTKAESSLVELTRVVKETKQVQTNLEKQLAIAEAGKEALVVYNIAEEEEKKNKCDRYAYILEHLEPMQPLAKLEAPPSRKPIIVPTLQLFKLHKPKCINITLELDENIMQIGEEMEEMKRGVCPVCKKRFFS